MGRIAESLIGSFLKETQNLEADDVAQAATQFTEGLQGDMPSPEEMAKEGYDPQHISYIAAQNFAASFAEAVGGLDTFDEFAQALERAEDTYMPSAPPMSPIADSFFWTWALFDLRFGADRETLGSCLLELMRSLQAPDSMLSVLEKYSSSRMGVYEHCGECNGKIRLRELITGDELSCHPASGYFGRKKELWFVRLAPPLSDDFDYHVAVTTPYLLAGASTEDWTAFLNKHLLEAEDKRLALHDFLKYGNNHVNWMEFVFQAYHHYQVDAIFLTGIPDVSASLPHSPEHDELAEESNPIDVNDQTVRVKLTEAQRKVIADMCPEISPRLRLTEKNQRIIELRKSELNRVIAAASRALPNTKGPRKNVLKKIIGISDLPATRSAEKKMASAKTIYQFKITLVGSQPVIWRRIETEDCSLADLHYQIQGAMGWENSHLHEFSIAGERYAAPHPLSLEPMDCDATDASTICLSELIGDQRKFRCDYLYDFGDSWEHRIELEEIHPGESRARYPRCTDGRRACPPEDCGGIPGFYDFVEAITNRKHPEHQEMKEWHGPFNPDTFDQKKATKEMR